MRRTASILVVIGALGLMLGLTTEPRAEEPARKDWVGKKVLPKHRDFTLRSSDGGAVIKGRVGSYKFKETKGPLLLVKKSGVSAWVEANQFVLIDDATKFFDGLVQANPRDGFGYSMRGLALIVDKHDIERAIADYDKAVQLDPNDALGYANRGTAWALKGEQDRATADLGQAIRLDPLHDTAYTCRGASWIKRQEYEKAIADLTEAI